LYAAEDAAASAWAAAKAARAAEWAAAWAKAAAEEYLLLMADIGLEILRDLKSPGVGLL
jgi:hypothetical protein